MGCSTAGTKVPVSLAFCPTNVRFLFLGCFLLVLSEAAKSPGFPGSVSCLNNGIKLRLPKKNSWASMQHLHIVDSAGAPMMDCDPLSFARKTLSVSDKCTKHEMGRRLVHLSFFNKTGQKDVTYSIICNDVQADDAYVTGDVVNCTKDFMSVKISRILSGFDDEMPATIVQPSYWNLEVIDGTRTRQLTMAQARQMGYTMTSDPLYLMIQASFNASGIKEFTFENQKLYLGDIRLSSQIGTPKIILNAPMACAKGPPTCNSTHMAILIPSFGGVLLGIALDNFDIPMRLYPLQQKGITLDSRNGAVALYIDKNFLKQDTTAGRPLYYLPSLKLTFNLNDRTIPMLLSPECPNEANPTAAVCTPDGYMDFEVVEAITQPELNLDTLRLGDGRCQPIEKSRSKVKFHVPLNDCGTTIRFVDDKAIYENEIHALWKDFPPRRISRDSEFRMTIVCSYAGNADATVIVNVATHPPFASSKSDGPLSLVLNLFLDNSYRDFYSEDQFPVVKTLRDPIYLEVQLLNRNDPNIDLVLNDCWTTMSQDPRAVPQWNIVVDGCQEDQDNYMTVFHPVGSSVEQPSHRKRFEVKTFAFVSGGEALTNLIYFHCSAIVCNKLAPDSPLCTKTCPQSRKRRDEMIMHKDASLVSLPGPILFTDSWTSVQHEDHTNDVVEHLPEGVLPVLGLAALIVLTVVLLSIFKWKKSKSIAH
ncbi:hypothetical protein FKM82_002821 [Ascaphus truei]